MARLLKGPRPVLFFWNGPNRRTTSLGVSKEPGKEVMLMGVRGLTTSPKKAGLWKSGICPVPRLRKGCWVSLQVLPSRRTPG